MVERRGDPKASQMNFRFVALALLAATASVASVRVFVPATAQNGVSPRSTGQSQPPAAAVPPKVSTPSLQNPAGSGATRSPVPLLLAYGRPVASATGTPLDSSPQGADAASPGKLTETAAKAAIEADGYKGVHTLSRGPDGVWKARALRGGTDVQLIVDHAGRVSTN